MVHDLVTIGDTKLDTFVVLHDAHLQCALREEDGGERRCYLCLEHGAKIPVDDFEPQIAGSAPNVAVGIARLGFRSAVLSVVGDDATGRLAFVRFKEEHVDARYVRVSKRERSSYSIVITYKGERTMLAAHRPHHYRLPALKPFSWLFISEMGTDYEDIFHAVVQLVKRQRAKLAFNPGIVQLQGGTRKLLPMLKVTEVLFVNKEEGATLLNNRTAPLDLHHTITSLWKLGPKVVVLTDGSRGSYAFDGGDVWHLPVLPAKPVEMTGAGDSFATGFLAARMRGKRVAECLRWGAANASSVIMRVGPQPGLLSKSGMAKALREHRAVTAKPL